VSSQCVRNSSSLDTLVRSATRRADFDEGIGSEYGTTKIGHLLASKRLLEASFAGELASRRREMTGAMDRASTLSLALDKCRELANSGKSIEAVPLLENSLADVPIHAEAHYLLACCLHWNDLDLLAALSHLNAAQDQGLGDFWFRYNRGRCTRNSPASTKRGRIWKPASHCSRNTKARVAL
jgi:hypothetical protein